MGQSDNKTHDATAAHFMKEFLVAQEYIVQGTHYYIVKAETMGMAVENIEDDPDLLPVDSEVVAYKILGYTEAEDNYDC